MRRLLRAQFHHARQLTLAIDEIGRVHRIQKRATATATATAMATATATAAAVAVAVDLAEALAMAAALALRKHVLSYPCKNLCLDPSLLCPPTPWPL